MNKNTKVTLYSTLTCPYCKMEKNWLDKNKIAHKIVFVDLNPFEAKKMVSETGQMGVPVTKIENDSQTPKFVIGFDHKKLSELLNIN